MTQNNSFRAEALLCISAKWGEALVRNETSKALEIAVAHFLPQEKPQTTAGQGLEGEALVGNNIYKLESNASVINEELSQINRIQAGGVNEYNCSSTVEELLGAFEYADSLEMFRAIVANEPIEVVKDAIALAASIPIRQLLRGFYETVYGQLDYLWGNIADRVANAAQASVQGLPG